MCAIAAVDRKSYYRFLKKHADDGGEVERVIALMKQIQEKTAYALGYRKMSCWLMNEHGIRIGKNRVLALMREQQLLSHVRRKRYTPQQYQVRRMLRENVPKNLLARNFNVSEPGKVYVSDITYLLGIGVTKYLAVIADLHNGEIVAWRIGFHPDQKLCASCLDILCKKRAVSGALLHSDEGSSYLALDYRQALYERGIIQSCSEKGQCWDNAPMESFNGILKSECLYNRFEKTAVKNHRIPIEQIEQAVKEYIVIYNCRRPREKLGGVSPVEYRLANKKVGHVCGSGQQI